MREHLTKAAKHTFVYGFGQILGKLVSFMLIPFYTHYLQPADYGVMEIMNLTTMILAMVAALGMPSAIVRFYYDSKVEAERNEVISTGILYSFVVGGVLTGISFVLAPFLSKLMFGDAGQVLVIRLAMGGFFFTFCTDAAWSFLRAKQRSTLYTTLNQAFILISISLNIYLIAFRKMGVAGVFAGTFVAAGLVWIVLMAITFRDVGHHFSPAKLKAMLLFGTPLLSAWFAAFVLNYSDRFFIQRFSDLSEVGLYSLAYKFGFIVSLAAVQPFQLMWQVQCYEIAEHENGPQTFSKIFTLYSTLLIALTLGLTLFIPEVFRIAVDQKYSVASGMVPVIALAYVAQGLGMFLQAGLLIKKKTKTIATIAVVCTAVCLALNFVLIRFWTMWGACIATLISFIVSSTVTFYFSRKSYRVEYRLKPLVNVIVVSAGIALLGWYFPAKGIATTIIAKCLLFLVFVLLLPKLGVVHMSELSSLKDWVAGRLRKRSAVAAGSEA